ncbi:hypothetical protein R1flu_011576 [Riccia fluitans]|uniref:Uncharacterized protein n=1 Tax=Riccia fluitans TaxID=41844 RepID=A0ABD1Z9D0_9MARC
MGMEEKSNVGGQEKVGTREDCKWGPCEIVKKTFEIYKAQTCTFTWIQVLIVFPCTVLWLLNQFLTRKWIHDYWPRPPCPGPCPPSPPMQFTFGDDPSPCDNFIPCEWKAVLAFFALFVFGFIFWINVVGAIFFAVGSAYAGKTICFKDVIAALPGLWKGLFVTAVWSYLFFLVTIASVFLLEYVLTAFASISFLPVPIVHLLTFTVGWILFFFTTTTNQMANGVTVFEQTCGPAAYCKALELLKFKWCVALGIAIIYFIPQAVLTVIVNAFTWACAGVWAKYVFFGVLANLLAVVLQLNIMSSAIFYLSAKQSNNEFISVDHFSYGQLTGEYQRIGV